LGLIYALESDLSGDIMNKNNGKSSADKLAKLANGLDKQRYLLKLYVAGITPQSKDAIQNITQICEENLLGRYDLQIIDIYRNPTLAVGEQIIAAPTLIKKLPLPLRKFIGNMSDKEKILVGLDLRQKISK
jgi:circadian clock protein KaiB